MGRWRVGGGYTDLADLGVAMVEKLDELWNSMVSVESGTKGSSHTSSSSVGMASRLEHVVVRGKMPSAG